MNSIWRHSYKIVDTIRRTNAAKLFDELLQTQWLSEDELRDLQFQRLRNLLIHSQENVPFYKQLFLEHEFNANKFSSFDDFKKLPILTKDGVRNNLPQMKAVNFSHWKPRKTQTGGSTGKPLVTFKDKESHSYLTANNLRAWNAAGYEIGDKFITMANGSLLPNKGSIKNSIYYFLQHSDLIKSYHMDDATLADALRKIKKSVGRYMFAYSSSTFLLASYAASKNIPMKGTLDAIFTTSDMLFSRQRQLIEKVFDAPVFDIYGCPEAGIISFECKQHNGYHLNQESAYVEIADSDESGLGRIISTPLFNYAMPMIRYETGDIGKISSELCSCGRALPQISHLGGRMRDFIVLSDGRHIHGAFFNHLEALYQSEWIEKYQIIQESTNHLIIKINCIRQPSEPELSKIKTSLLTGLLSDLKIDFNLNGVEIAPSGKFRLIISKVKTAWEK